MPARPFGKRKFDRIRQKLNTLVTPVMDVPGIGRNPVFKVVRIDHIRQITGNLL